MARYAAMRAAMFRDRLQLLPAYFAGREVLEFGPDTGENALVFASWGASLTLVEPNEAAHPTIRSYFERFGANRALRGLVSGDVLGYRDDCRYDIVIAEGFIHTVKPVSAWLAAFRRLLRDEGLFVVSYYERAGGFVELTLKALHAAYRRATGLAPLPAAEQLYSAKWESIPHTRAFAAWVFDVLENPFQRLVNFIDAAALVDEALAAGFDVYASYPRYGDVLEMEWHKYVVPPAERAARARRHVARSVLSFMTGRALYVGDDALAGEIGRDCTELVEMVDRLIDADVPGAAERVAQMCENVARLTGDRAIAGAMPDRAAAASGLHSLARAFRLAAAADAAGLKAHASTDAAFIATWGAPNHHAVGRALPGP